MRLTIIRHEIWLGLLSPLSCIETCLQDFKLTIKKQDLTLIQMYWDKSKSAVKFYNTRTTQDLTWVLQ